jgi:predicted RNase H-like nuclease (RuvC/YqgF family)
MLTDLLNSIYKRIAQLGQAIQGLKTSLDGLNQNIEQKISNLNEKLKEFSEEIEVTKGKHIEVLKDIGESTKLELMKIQEGLGLDALETLVKNLEEFAKLSGEVLNQDTVNLLLSEAISSVKSMKKISQNNV